jgi:hypothetical protein
MDETYCIWLGGHGRTKVSKPGDVNVALYNVLYQRLETLHNGAVAADDVLASHARNAPGPYQA